MPSPDYCRGDDQRDTFTYICPPSGPNTVLLIRHFTFYPPRAQHKQTQDKAWSTPPPPTLDCLSVINHKAEFISIVIDIYARFSMKREEASIHLILSCSDEGRLTETLAMQIKWSFAIRCAEAIFLQPCLPVVFTLTFSSSYFYSNSGSWPSNRLCWPWPCLLFIYGTFR